MRISLSGKLHDEFASALGHARQFPSRSLVMPVVGINRGIKRTRVGQYGPHYSVRYSSWLALMSRLPLPRSAGVKLRGCSGAGYASPPRYRASRSFSRYARSASHTAASGDTPRAWRYVSKRLSNSSGRVILRDFTSPFYQPRIASYPENQTTRRRST